jgi:K+-transporting ATPase KdpF subunit
MFRGRIFVCPCVQPPKGEVMIENIILLVISAALMVYLVFALLRPEKF